MPSVRGSHEWQVERPIGYVRGNFIYGREFVGDVDLDEQARRCWTGSPTCGGTAQERPMDRSSGTRRAA